MANQEHYRQRLVAAALELNLELGMEQADTLLAYMAQLQRWNRTYNLTALREPDQMLVQHLFDSLSVVVPLTEILDKNTVLNPCIVDVGSGAGLPGVVLAVLRPHWQVHCIDAVEKKMAFVRQMAAVLRLSNLHAVHARIEALPPFNADIIVSRAFASLLDFATLAGQHVDARGQLAAMKGREPHDEVVTLEQQTEWRVRQIQPLLVPELNAQRCLVWLSRQGNP
ncbi:16S rRNA (guanine(527)-N(7))-methyltransferase RsmG [Alcaligenaceae bacterium]|nr:16S rRNA (guanine(527)-N(7))-methyltransferase RsmG [Alcaligenaceae bacterium]